VGIGKKKKKPGGKKGLLQASEQSRHTMFRDKLKRTLEELRGRGKHSEPIAEGEKKKFRGGGKREVN